MNIKDNFVYRIFLVFCIPDLCTNEVILRPMVGEMNRVNGNHQTIMVAFFFQGMNWNCCRDVIT